MAGKGVGDAVGPIKTGINVGQTISETLFPQTKQVFKDYWSGDIAKGAFNSEDYTCQLFLRCRREIFILGVLGFLKTTRSFPKIPE